MTIYADFCAAVAAWAAARSPSLPVYYPDTDQRPAEDEFLQVAWFPGETTNLYMGNADPALLQGIGQVTVHVRQRPGAMAQAMRLADEVIAAFAKGTTFGAARVEVQPFASLADVEDDRALVPVTIRWRA